MDTKRNGYGALVMPYPEWLGSIQKELDGSNGAWNSGITKNHSSKARGVAVNVDLYAIDEVKQLAVVQVRQCIFHEKHYNEVRKNYYLIGRNENGNAFAHPIETIARNKKALATAEGGVALALSRIWDCDAEDVDDIIRNGDVAFIPVKSATVKSAEKVEDNYITFGESHVLVSAEIYKVGKVFYVKGQAKILHKKGQHPTAKTKSGVWRVQEGIRGSQWDFSKATAD